MLVVVLNACVTDTKLTLAASMISTILAKSDKLRDTRVTAVIIKFRNQFPAFMHLTLDISTAGFALSIEAIKCLLQPLFR